MNPDDARAKGTLDEMLDALSGDALSVLEHTLGWPDNPGSRNYFVASAGHHDLPHIEELVRANLMYPAHERLNGRLIGEGQAMFHATRDGRLLLQLKALKEKMA